MDTLQSVWTWLSDPGNQKTLALLGSASAAIVAAAWAIFRYIRPPKTSDRRPLSTQVIKQHVEQGATAVIQTGGGQVYLTKGISPEEFQHVAAKLGITQAAVKNFLKILEHKDIPPEEYDSTFRKIAKTYKALEHNLERFTSSDPVLIALKEKAKEAVVKGDFGQAEALLKKAKNKDIEAAKRLKEIAEERMLSAAASLAQIGRLKEIQLDYNEAAFRYRQASELVPEENLFLAEYLSSWGMASFQAGKYVEAEKPLKRSLEIHLEIYEKAPQHFEAGISCDRLARCYWVQGKYAEAEPLWKRTLAIFEKVPWPDDRFAAQMRCNLAGVYREQGRYAEAEALYERSLTVMEKVYGADHPNVGGIYENMAKLYKKIGKEDEAERLEERARKIRDHQIPYDLPARNEFAC